MDSSTSYLRGNSIVETCADYCPDTSKFQANHCYWDEALFDCFHDFSGHSSSHAAEDFQVTTTRSAETATTSGFGLGSVNVTVSSADQPLQNYHDDDDDDDDDGGHAALHYDDVEEAGPPARPQEFPTPFVIEGLRTTLRAMDHRTRKVRDVRNVLVAVATLNRGTSSTKQSPLLPPTSIADQAYLLKKKVAKSQHGNRYIGVILRRRSSPSNSFDDENEKRPEEDYHVEWESTEQFVTITVSPWSHAMRIHRRSISYTSQGPVHAIAAMQHVGNYHPNVQGLIAAFEDHEHLYTVSRVNADSIDLQTKILAGRSQGQYVPNEPAARVIFHQLLQGIFHLQRKGVCHANLSLENVYIDRTTNDHLMIVDLGRAMRIPYNDPSNFGCLTGESEGTARRLLQLLPPDFANHPTDNMMYLAPEIVENEDAFDGFAADLWAAGCILFVLLVGMAPFKTAHYWDAAYAEISSGNLHGLLASLNIQLSPEAIGLLQNMFWRDPRDRLTLANIMDHPWVKNQRFVPKRTSAVSNTPVTNSGDDLTRNVSNTQLSALDTSSTGSTLSTGKKSRHKKSSFTKTISGMFSSSPTSPRSAKHRNSDSSVKSSGSGWSGLLSSSPRGNKGRRSSLGGLSSAASSATAGSPLSSKFLSSEDEKESSAFGFQVLQLPKL